MMTLKALPNLLTALRIVLAVLVFLGLCAAADALPFQDDLTDLAVRRDLLLLCAAAFVFGAITDYFDGWLARKLDAQSPWGAMLDPIADKMAAAGAILGLVALEPNGTVTLAGGIILFREFFVSGLRETGASRGLALPVSQLAKWKTTAQLVALSAEMISAAYGGGNVRVFAHALLWIAAALTLWTGAEYAVAAAKGLKKT